MIAASELLPFVTLGLLGALHCAGMCGGFALAVAGRTSSSSSRAVWLRQLLYGVGKASSYAVVGVALALGAERFEAGFGAARPWMGAGAGLLLIAMGLAQWGFPLRSRFGEELLRRVARPLSAALARVRSLPTWSGSFGTGVVNGLVPCGLSWSAFLLAGRSHPATALVGCFLFGLATLPALVCVGWIAAHARPRFDRWVPFVLGAALVFFGARLLLAGFAPADGADCCAALPGSAERCVDLVTGVRR